MKIAKLNLSLIYKHF